MTNATHTPGPWTADANGHQVRTTDHKGNFPICDIRGWGHLTGKGVGALGLDPADAVEIQRANARLIAAAPAMLVALETAHSLLCAVPSADLRSDFAKTSIRTAVRETRAAIVEVTGSAPVRVRKTKSQVESR